MTLGDRLKHSWNAFVNPTNGFKYDYGRSSYINPNRVRMSMGNERSIVTAVYNRIAIDVSMLDIKHVKALLLRKKRMQIIDAFYATYQNKFILECDVFPCSQKRGCSDKIYLEISDFDDFNIVTDSEKIE